MEVRFREHVETVPSHACVVAMPPHLGFTVGLSSWKAFGFLRRAVRSGKVS